MAKILVESKISLVNQSSFERDHESLISATTVCMVNNFRHHVTQMKKKLFTVTEWNQAQKSCFIWSKEQGMHWKENTKMLILIFQSESSPKFCRRKFVVKKIYKLSQISVKTKRSRRFECRPFVRANNFCTICLTVSLKGKWHREKLFAFWGLNNSHNFQNLSGFCHEVLVRLRAKTLDCDIWLTRMDIIVQTTLQGLMRPHKLRNEVSKTCSFQDTLKKVNSLTDSPHVFLFFVFFVASKTSINTPNNACCALLVIFPLT